MTNPRITILKNGPLKVEGGVELEDHDGTSLETPSSKAYHLCRCGASEKKPFCDGRHKHCDFDGTLS
ncbi:MAG: hypothetical protein CME30_03725 [Gemmatimonadetes bacterium]|nr:hypothetical protein [Gemmatimonadota bacterium]